MFIEAKEYTIKMDADELWDLAYSVRDSLIYAIKNHWINHQNVWQKNEAKKLKLLKTMFCALGQLEAYERIFIEANEIFIKFNSK